MIVYMEHSCPEQNRRVFLALDLPAEIKEEISKTVAKIKRILPQGVRFIPPENWHITLIFIGDQKESEIEKIAQAIQNIAPTFSIPEISLNSISYGPNESRPRMVWGTLNLETSEKIGKLCDKLGLALEGKGIAIKNEGRNFNGHITLARIADYIQKSKLPSLIFPISLKFKVESVTFFESKLNPSGANYSIIKTFFFRAN